MNRQKKTTIYNNVSVLLLTLQTIMFSGYPSGLDFLLSFLDKHVKIIIRILYNLWFLYARLLDTVTGRIIVLHVTL